MAKVRSSVCEPRAVKTTQEVDDAVITANRVVSPVSKAAEQLGTRLRSLEAMTRTVRSEQRERFDISVGDDTGSEPVAVPEEQGETSGDEHTPPPPPKHHSVRPGPGK